MKLTTRTVRVAFTDPDPLGLGALLPFETLERVYNSFSDSRYPRRNDLFKRFPNQRFLNPEVVDAELVDSNDIVDAEVIGSELKSPTIQQVVDLFQTLTPGTKVSLTKNGERIEGQVQQIHRFSEGTPWPDQVGAIDINTVKGIERVSAVEPYELIKVF